ncbi:glycoside hydrolase family 16 protein [Lichenihabitans sp. Uapishka_5]|uniref:glycoside hydrolase family 16 protein n=1 Tax=Lichenihabitans sp. Uapishka_5 TaxID=3037302 RepID=UPI0029E81FFA|nr:glycoside hydrolase family 16 protein [Lichenihabitans sp. Uapishka_5]MDX7950400.1 glycoside hydrolase family 16 protein [Lichenihabitans sp. Uapishka_5]
MTPLPRSVLLILAGLSSVLGAALAHGETLDLSEYAPTFTEEFKTLDISARGPNTRWIAHTPWNGDFGDAAFADPGPGGPFSLTPEGLRIAAARTADGRWVSGLICSMDRDGPGQQGFAQRYGYFEMTAKLPEGSGTWPAFWLVGTDKRLASAEIDIIEFYGGFPQYYHAVQHIWVDGKDRYGRDKRVEVPPHLLSDRFNSFGVRITPDTTTFFLNRNSVWSTPTAPEYRQPLYVLANLALGGGWPMADLQPPVIMQIAAIRVFQSKALLPGADHAGP